MVCTGEAAQGSVRWSPLPLPLPQPYGAEGEGAEGPPVSSLPPGHRDLPTTREDTGQPKRPAPRPVCLVLVLGRGMERDGGAVQPVFPGVDGEAERCAASRQAPLEPKYRASTRGAECGHPRHGGRREKQGAEIRGMCRVAQ